MVLTEKEISLLKDMKSEEELCIKKYSKYAAEAKSTQLNSLLSSISKTESNHLKIICDMMSGKEPEAPSRLSANNEYCTAYSYQNEQDRESDAFYCQDMLAMEKHVSALYNTGVFEFTCPAARRMLNHIQSEEQQHGEQLYAYMKANNMYC